MPIVLSGDINMKKNMLKKLLVSMIVIGVLVSTMACNPSNKQVGLEGDMENVTYKVYFRQSIVEYPPDGGETKPKLLQLWKDDLGITNTDYMVSMATGTDYDTKLNTMMAGGDIPDLFICDIDDLATLVNNGVIAPIDDLVALMPVYAELLEDPIAEASYNNFSIDGKHYGFISPALPGPLNNVGTDGLTMRIDWLENLGLRKPTTIEELHDVLYAFTYDDPDKNGEDDTYGLSGYKSSMFASIFAAYGIYLNGINSWTEIDGKLVHSTTLDETKQVLALLRDWYIEGIIDPDKFIVESSQSDDKFIGNKFGVHESSVWANNSARTAWGGIGSEGVCEFIEYPKGPDGKSGFPISAVATYATVVSAEYIENSDPKRLAAILNWMVDDSDEGGMRFVQYGLEDDDYLYNRETQTIVEFESDYSKKYARGYSNPIRWIQVVDRRWIPVGDGRITDFEISNNQDNWLVSKFAGSVPAMKDYPDLYEKLWSEYFTKIIVGAIDISEFDTYRKEFYSQGGQELTDQVNAAWIAKK